MNLKSLYISSLSLVALSVFAIFAYKLLPERTLALFPSATFGLYSGADEEFGGKSAAAFLDNSFSQWQCFLREGIAPPAFPSCRIGISLSQSAEDWSAGVDLSKYESIRFKYRYQGPAKFIRVHFRNFDETISDVNDYNSGKFIQLVIREPSGNIDVRYLLTEFKLADWWIQQFSVPTSQAKIAFDRVTSMEIDFAEPVPYGEHFIELQSIEMLGHFFTEEHWYLGILVFWLLAIAVVVSVRLRQLLVVSRSQEQAIRLAHERTKALKKESLESHNRSRYDALTGVLNRYGFNEIIESAFDWRVDENQIALLVVDVDNFKTINDDRGHDVGDAVLAALGKLLLNNTRVSDSVARWGGEEFVIVCPRVPREAAQLIAEKLRVNIQTTRFFEDAPTEVTVSIGVTIIDTKESFSTAFKRADEALFDAKDQGRNRWVFA